MNKNEFSVGALLKDKNALINYIYEDGVKIGVVVGMKGKDRNTPLVGWCLFKEIPSALVYSTYTPIKNWDVVQKDIKVVEDALLNVGDTAETYNVLKSFEKILNLKAIVPVSNLCDSELYYVVEKALLRANPNRDSFFVSTNPAYGQSNSHLIPNYRGKGGSCIELDTGECVHNEITLTLVRKAVRAMEYRCWKYFKDGSNDNN